MTTSQKDAGPRLGVFSLVMINAAAILSLRALPGMAEYGYAMVTYLGLASLCFFVPSALVSAELASGWRGEGGVYDWVKEAFGARWGFVAIFMQWVENLPWFPAVLAFTASSLAYVINPALAENKIFVVSVIWIALWFSTLLNLRGMRLSTLLSSSGVILGTLIPGLWIILLGIRYLLTGGAPAISLGPDALMPNLENAGQLMLLAAMLVSFQGMEMSAAHVNSVRNPGRDYPRAILLSCLLIVALSVFGSLAIAMVVPPSRLSLSAGVCQAFERVFTAHGHPWMTGIVCLLMAYGGLTTVATWMVGPSKGIRQAADDGFLPASWSKTNSAGMPVNILYIQSGLSSVLSLAILFMPSVGSAFMLMSALAAQLYMVMYLLMFAAAIRLRITRPEVRRGYKIPGGLVGVWVVCGTAFATSLFVMICGFIPPDSVRTEGLVAQIAYVAFLLVGMAVFTGMPLYFYARANRCNNTAAATLQPDSPFEENER